MSRNVYIAFITAFALCIYSVGIIQAVYELAQKKPIQMLDIVGDTFAKPRTRANAIHNALTGLQKRMGDIRKGIAEGSAGGNEEFDWYDVATVAEEAIYDEWLTARKSAMDVNTYITLDTTHKSIAPFDSLRRPLDELYDALQNEDPTEATAALTAVEERLGPLLKRYPHRTILSTPVLAWNAFWAHTVFSQRYLRSWEGEMESTSICANTTRPVLQFLRYAMMNDLGEKGVLGRKGWFFYTPGVNYLTYPYVRDKRSMIDTTTNIIDESPALMREGDPLVAIPRFKRQLAEYGVELLVVIVPGKGSVYPDMLSPKARPEDACMFSHSIPTIAALRDSGVDVVDLFGPFAEERANDSASNDSLYLQKDTHWKARGLRLCAKLVAERVRQYSWYDTAWETTEYALEPMVVMRDGDIGTMTNLPDFTVRQLNLSFEPESTDCFQVQQVRRDDEGNEIGRLPYRDDPRSHILVLGDSFSRIYQTDDPRSAGWISHLSYELSQPVLSLVSDGGASTLVRERLARKPKALRGKKLVVWEFVERDLRFGEKGWQDIAIEM